VVRLIAGINPFRHGRRRVPQVLADLGHGHAGADHPDGGGVADVVRCHVFEAGPFDGARERLLDVLAGRLVVFDQVTADVLVAQVLQDLAQGFGHRHGGALLSRGLDSQPNLVAVPADLRPGHLQDGLLAPGGGDGQVQEHLDVGARRIEQLGKFVTGQPAITRLGCRRRLDDRRRSVPPQRGGKGAQFLPNGAVLGAGVAAALGVVAAGLAADLLRRQLGEKGFQVFPGIAGPVLVDGPLRQVIDIGLGDIRDRVAQRSGEGIPDLAGLPFGSVTILPFGGQAG